MSSPRTSLLILGLIALGVTQAQAQTRVRGTITTLETNGFVVDGKIQVRLGEKTEIVFNQPITLAELKRGDFLGVTSMKRADGTLTAYEVRRFPKPEWA